MQHHTNIAAPPCSQGCCDSVRACKRGNCCADQACTRGNCCADQVCKCDNCGTGRACKCDNYDNGQACKCDNCGNGQACKCDNCGNGQACKCDNCCADQACKCDKYGTGRVCTNGNNVYVGVPYGGAQTNDYSASKACCCGPALSTQPRQLDLYNLVREFVDLKKREVECHERRGGEVAARRRGSPCRSRSPQVCPPHMAGPHHPMGPPPPHHPMGPPPPHHPMGPPSPHHHPMGPPSPHHHPMGPPSPHHHPMGPPPHHHPMRPHMMGAYPPHMMGAYPPYMMGAYPPYMMGAYPPYMMGPYPPQMMEAHSHHAYPPHMRASCQRVGRNSTLPCSMNPCSSPPYVCPCNCNAPTAEVPKVVKCVPLRAPESAVADVVPVLSPIQVVPPILKPAAEAEEPHVVVCVEKVVLVDVPSSCECKEECCAEACCGGEKCECCLPKERDAPADKNAQPEGDKTCSGTGDKKEE